MNIIKRVLRKSKKIAKKVKKKFKKKIKKIKKTNKKTINKFKKVKEQKGTKAMYQEIWATITFGIYDKRRIKRLKKFPPALVENRMLFETNDDFTDNGRALFDYLIENGYNKKYEYLTSRYYRDNGESVRSATGYIDPAVFSDNYPLSCDKYEGSADGQNDFMEESRVGICDLIHCLKKFVEVENMECDFSAFDFANF